MVISADAPTSDSRSELVFGLVGAVGSDLATESRTLERCLEKFGYDVCEIRVSRDVIPRTGHFVKPRKDNEYHRIKTLMDCGNNARTSAKDNAILALGVANFISESRTDSTKGSNVPRAYVVRSLKHPDEVRMLRGIYGEGFYLVGVFSDLKFRRASLQKSIKSTQKIDELIARDEDEHLDYGQRTRDTFHMADFFVHSESNPSKSRNSIERFIDLVFGHPFVTPTPDEYAMFLAFSASLRSADLSRQVGAVIAREGNIMATGANDCPSYGGGVYWPVVDHKSGRVTDLPRGRDFTRKGDSNAIAKGRIIDDIMNQFKNDMREGADKASIRTRIANSLVKDITEYGRVVHAEMEALLSCARRGVACNDATIYSTTYPCHNCAKHIVAAGVVRVVYIEPYPKSKAYEFHDEVIAHEFQHRLGKKSRVSFEPFIGVGPRRFFDLFSIALGSGAPVIRKKSDGSSVDWSRKLAAPRLPLVATTYIEREDVAVLEFGKKTGGGGDGQ